MINTTIASFSAGSPFATAQTLVWEYDQTQYLQIEGLELPYSCSVDYCNVGDSSTITMPCVQGKAEIPNDFFETGKNIKAYVVLTDDASVQTRYEIVIPVIKRPTRTDIQPTPAEQQQIDALLQALSDGVDAANEAADEASDSAAAALASEQSAQASASEADQAASSAAASVAEVRGYANDAEQAATAAAMSESNAGASAQASAASAQSASDSATSAADSASAAVDAVSDAAGYANEASQYATAAEQYASNASGYASDASDSASDAAQKASDASASATAAAQSADNASAKASEASTSATNASASATAAATSATAAANAQTAAETAQGKAEDAQEAAETAQEAAEQAAREAETALVNKADVITDTASGSIASFPDGADNAPMVSVVCEINPQQDLHGYDSPWPAGGGKNKFPTTITQKSSTVDYSDGKITMHPLSAQTQIIMFPFIGDGETRYTWSFYAYSDIDNTAFACDGQPDSGGTGLAADHAITVTTTPTRFVFTGILPATNTALRFFRTNTRPNAETATIYIYDIQIEVGSEATTFAPYENICPITGWDSVTVNRTGKNLADISNAANATNVVDSVDADGKIHFKDVTARWSSTYIGKMFVKAGETYTLSGGIAYGRIGLSTNTSYPQNGVNIPDITILGGGDAPSVLTKDRTVNSFTANYTGYMYAFYCSDTHYAEAHGEFSCYVFCNIGSTATTYEPYNGNTYAVDWTSEAGTVYGGTLDVTNGKLTVDRAMVDMGTLTWTKSNTSSGKWWFSVIRADAKKAPSNVQKANCICSSYEIKTPNNLWGGRLGAGVNAFAPQIIVADLSYDDANTFKTAMSGVQFVYELATPIVYDLTPTEVTTLLGTNSIWHDANGDTTATYRADTTLYIDKKLSTITAMLTAYIEASMTASRAYAVNDFINVNGQLYRVTTPIANGGTITPGTNATATTIGTQLTTIINS